MSPIARVMVVDDDDDIRTIADLALREIGGWQTICLGSSRAAVLLAATERPDVILLDVMMPELDGQGTIKRLREDPRTAGIPVVFMTAKAQPAELARYAALGAVGVIAKPFDPLGLADEIRRLVGIHGDPP